MVEKKVTYILGSALGVLDGLKVTTNFELV